MNTAKSWILAQGSWLIASYKYTLEALYSEDDFYHYLRIKILKYIVISFMSISLHNKTLPMKFNRILRHKTFSLDLKAKIIFILFKNLCKTALISFSSYYSCHTIKSLEHKPSSNISQPELKPPYLLTRSSFWM